MNGLWGWVEATTACEEPLVMGFCDHSLAKSRKKKGGVLRSSRSCPTLIEKSAKSVSFDEEVRLLRFKPKPHTVPLWYEAEDYSGFVSDELSRRRHLGIHTTSLLITTDVAHAEAPKDASRPGAQLVG